MREEYDVIVVGSGPAGATTAEACAKRGLSVLILERNEKVGEPVRCAEGVSNSSVERLKLDIPRECISEEIDGAVVYAPNGKEIKIKFEGSRGYVLERKKFDKWLAANATKKGTELVMNANVTDVIKVSGRTAGVVAEINGDKKELLSKVVVAADGTEGLTARRAGLTKAKNPHFVDTGYQYLMEDVEIKHPRMIVLYFGNKIAPRGYVWIFPKGRDRANVGIGISGAGAEKTAKQYLDEWIASQPGIKKGRILETGGGCIPVGNFMEKMSMPGLVAVGDAANQVNPIHGGGIAESILAGRMAGEVIASHLRGEASLEEYDKRWWAEAGQRLKKAEKVREIMENLNDEQLCDLAELLSKEDLVDFVHGKNVIKLVKLYAKFKLKGVKRKIGFK